LLVLALYDEKSNLEKAMKAKQEENKQAKAGKHSDYDL